MSIAPRRDRKLAYRLIVLQLVLSALLIGVAAVYDTTAVAAVAVGGLTSTAANGFYVWMALKAAIAAPAAEVARNFYIGAVGKFLVVVVSLAVAFSVLDTLGDTRNALVLFATLIVVHSGYWVAPALEGFANNRPR